MKKVVIGITECSKYENYANWIAQENDVEILQLSYKENNLSDLEKCGAIVLTGGEDINPVLYHKPDYQKFCEDKIDKRDAFEWKVLEYSQKKQIPLLGICRGLQIGNAFFGGTLIPDLITWGKEKHSKVKGYDLYHQVSVEPGSLLHEITKSESGEVNSAHHQSADQVADGLMITATSSDGVIEGLERKNRNGKSFLLFVQWHPERMKDQESSFASGIRKEFVRQVRDSISS
jgi:putative glutamine amidotransferase